MGEQAVVADLERFLTENPNHESFLYASLGAEESEGMKEMQRQEWQRWCP